MDANDVAARLGDLRPLKLEAVHWIVELESMQLGTSPKLNKDVALQAYLADIQNDLDEAVLQLMGHAKQVNKVVKRCGYLRPVPGKLPPGF